MWFSYLLQRGNSWHFDPASALIGAIIAWVIAIVVYVRRETIRQQFEKIWSPVTQARRRLQASSDEKYLHALRENLRPLWLFSPKDPRMVFLPPILETLPPLPRTASESGELPTPLLVPFNDLSDNYSRLLITGAQGAGRTTSLIRLAWAAIENEPLAPGAEAPTPRFPLWGDLSLWTSLPAKKNVGPIERLAQLAGLSLPNASPGWLAGRLRSQPSIIFLDNWETLPPEMREPVARTLIEAAAKLPNSNWVIAAGLDGYGHLVEGGFVPLNLPLQPIDEDALARLYTGWAGLPTPDIQSIPEEARRQLQWAIETGDSPLHLTLRIQLYLLQSQLPPRIADVFQGLLEQHVKPVAPEGENTEQLQLINKLVAASLAHIGRTARLEKRALTQPELQAFIVGQLPAENGEKVNNKLEGAVRKRVQKSGLVRREGQDLRLVHYVWEDYLAARALAEESDAAQRFIEHRDDPTWAFFLECFIGVGDATPLIKATMAESLNQGKQDLMLYVIRWAILAPENVTWRKPLMVTLAKTFMDPTLDPDFRLRLGRGIALVTGENARIFFLQALQQAKSSELRSAALRGLGWVGTPQEMAYLAAALKDSYPEVRQSAIQALGDMGTPGAYKTLRQALYNSEEELMVMIAEVLARAPEGWEVLREASTGGDILVRRAAAVGLGLVRKPWTRELLQKMTMEDTQWLVRSAAEESFNAQVAVVPKVMIPPPPAIDQADWLIQWAARHGRGLGVGEAAVGALQEALLGNEIDAAVLAAQTLAYLGRQEHLDLLRSLLDDPRPAVQTAAARAYELIEQRYRGTSAPPPPAEPEAQS